MRRTEREILDTAFMHQVLAEAEVLSLAMNAEGAPYVIPLNYVFHDGYIYIHCAKEGRKWDLALADPRVAFTTALDIAVDGTTTRYRSVCGTGRISIVEDADEKNAALRALAVKFKAPCVFPVSEKKFAITGMLRISIETLTAKHSRRSEGKRPMPHYEQ